MILGFKTATIPKADVIRALKAGSWPGFQGLESWGSFFSCWSRPVPIERLLWLLDSVEEVLPWPKAQIFGNLRDASLHILGFPG